jgi:pseudoazurin
LRKRNVGNACLSHNDRDMQRIGTGKDPAMRTFAALLAAAALTAGAAEAATHEVKMLNRGETGAMVFEPAFIMAAPGDEIVFLSTDRGHNAESIEGMLPAGVEAFKSRLGDDFTLTVTEEGVYGIKCTPHYAMGMVAIVQVGEATNAAEAQAVTHRGKAKTVFDGLFGQVQ